MAANAKYDATIAKLATIVGKVKNLRDQGLEAADEGNDRKIKLFKLKFKQLKSWVQDHGKSADNILAMDKRPQSHDIQVFIKSLTEFDDLVAEVQLIHEELDTDCNNLSVRGEGRDITSLPARLPKIPVPVFTGIETEWMSFITLFQSLVGENHTLSNVERLHYLRVSVQGEALNIINGLSLTNENYSVALQLLRNRYENVRRTATLHADKVINFPASQVTSAQHMRGLITTYRENIEALRALKVIPTTGENGTDSFFLFLILLRKLDSVTRCHFERSLESNKEIPSSERLIRFLERECEALEASQEMHCKNMVRGRSENVHTTLLSADDGQICVGCQEITNHRLFQCNGFLRRAIPERKRLVIDHKLCFNCLLPHLVETCTSPSRCRLCKGKHHSMIHSFNRRNEVGTSNSSRAGNRSLHAVHSSGEEVDNYNAVEDERNGTETFVAAASVSKESAHQVVLSTVMLDVQNAEGHYESVRALLDTGSQASYITAHCAQRLRLPTRNVNVRVSGIGQTNIDARGSVVLHVSGRSRGIQLMTVEALVLGNITGRLPTAPLPAEWRSRLSNLWLADPDFDCPQPIDCLLGADVFARCLREGRMDLGERGPMMLNTLFGWILMGSYTTSAPTSTESLIACHAVIQEPVECILPKFWAIEEPVRPAICSFSNDEGEKHFRETFSRAADGRYVVRLPFKSTNLELGSSFHQAESRFFALERRLVKDPQTYGMYKDFMREYISAGHMELHDQCIDTIRQTDHYFMPHHGVLKPSSSTTKLRVVFDASSKTTGNSRPSLNDLLWSGPKLQKDIVEIITRFRSHPVVFMADIKQMFRGIWLHPDDRKFQLILWRESPEDQLRTFRLKTVTFGVTCSPFLAMRSIQQLTMDEGEGFAGASRVLQNDVFVDDVVSGTDSVEMALQLQKDLIHLLSLAGFQLRKWVSNSPELIDAVAQEEREIPVSFSHPDDPMFQVLGLGWNARSDNLVFSVELPDYRCTKRGVLSCIARMYDPLGLITPVTFWAKCMLQRLWISGVGWDDPLPDELSEKWQGFASELSRLSDFSVPRLLPSGRGELHGFCDASERGYAAVVYFLSDAEDGKALSLLMAKSKVAPLKQVSLPRLELCGAHLLAKLLRYCISMLGEFLVLGQCTAWSDSNIALAWIRTPPYQLKTFVANRVAEIQTLLPNGVWKHVPTSVNPADVASRGLYPTQLLDSAWVSGPAFLLSDRPDLVSQPLINLKNLPERKTDPLNLLLATEIMPDLTFLERFSSWSRMLRVVAYMVRFCHNVRHVDSRRYAQLSCSELRIAEMAILKMVQGQGFQSEIRAIERGQVCSDRLQRLSPFLDPAGLLRVGGRIGESNLAYTSKHPILLPKEHHVTHILIDHFHRLYLHVGPRTLQSLMARRYWILSFRESVRRRIYRCVPCFRNKPRNQPPLMAELPPHRVRPARPFSSAHVDFAGPFVARTHKRSRARNKMYLCLFICSSTKAVHLEVVSDMSTNAFIAALNRFVSRRGLCQNIYSDQGTNLVGASMELKRVIKKLHSSPSREELHLFAAEKGITWHFQPPAAPHFGGLHEAAIKMAKHHITRVMGIQVLTYEELQTLFCQVEAILNSRPLCALSSDPGEADVLTPAHFLIGEPLVMLPEAKGNPVSLQTRWKLVQNIRSHFWTKWSREYLHTIIERSKWYRRAETVKLNDLVLIQEDRLPPMQWKLGRIIAVSPGSDGVIRVVHLQTGHGKLTRPAVKVFPLPLA